MNEKNNCLTSQNIDRKLPTNSGRKPSSTLIAHFI